MGRIILLLSVVLVCTLACNKERVVTEGGWPSNMGIMSASLNGRPWIADNVSATGTNGEVILSARGLSPEPQGHVLTFTDLELKKGLQTLLSFTSFGVVREKYRPDTAYSYLVIGAGDAVHAGYHLSPSLNMENSINIVSIEEDGMVTGTFEVTLVRDTSSKDRVFEGFPDTLRFTEGNFQIKL